jgi:hypothetical protein
VHRRFFGCGIADVENLTACERLSRRWARRVLAIQGYSGVTGAGNFEKKQDSPAAARLPQPLPQLVVAGVDDPAVVQAEPAAKARGNRSMRSPAASILGYPLTHQPMGRNRGLFDLKCFPPRGHTLRQFPLDQCPLGKFFRAPSAWQPS